MRFIEYFKKSFYLPILALIMIILAFIFNTPKEIFVGYKNILLSSSILTTDYIAIGTLGGALVNAASILILNLVILRLLNLRMSGLIYAALYMILGFSFFGKNILNSLPIYIGIYLYAFLNKIPVKNLVISLLFSSGISPLVSYLIFGFDLAYYISIPLGIGAGIVAGLMVPAISSHTIKFHQGYNLFNVGFSLGIISLAFNGVLRAFNLRASEISILSNDHNLFLYLFVAILALVLLIAGIILNPKSFKMIPDLYKRSGRLVSDYIRDYGVSIVMINQASLLTFEILICLIFKIELNGAIFGTILAVSGFAGAGLHLKNTSFVMLGAILMCLITKTNITSTSIIIGILFSAGVAPIAGRYGIVAGIIAGMLHIAILPLCRSFQGGYDLYNNGFCAGFVACILIAIIEAFKKED
ncbi:putative uncharacterized protein [Clostridium sp. CAG:307]|nr:putative uncharacterized protein [Clostridium sp. CAG:307]